MDQERRERLRKQLESLREQCQQQLKASRQIIITERPDGNLHGGSENHNNGAHLEIEISVAAGQAELSSHQLAAVNEQLERLDTSDYGFCEECGQEISEARLNALPFATLCIGCQETAEKAESGFRPKSRVVFAP